MSAIRILDGIELIRLVEVPGLTVVFNHEDAFATPVHLRQGQLDGACGPYAVLMALATAGFALDPSQLNRALKLIAGDDALLGRGTTGRDLRTFTREISAGQFRLRTLKSPAAGLQRDIAQALDDGNPVLVGLGLGHEEPGHWATCLGWEIPRTDLVFHAEEAELSVSLPDRFFLLDPSASRPTMTYWNGILTRVSGPGPSRYEYVLPHRVVDNARLEEAYAVVSRA